jgi:hypothetical protein
MALTLLANVMCIAACHQLLLLLLLFRPAPANLGGTVWGLFQARLWPVQSTRTARHAAVAAISVHKQAAASHAHAAIEP